MITWLRLAPRQVLIFLIELYRTWVSPMRLPTCRFEPTCSGYAVEALQRHGAVIGTVLSTYRLLRCGPWCKPGYDPVPERTLAQLLSRRPSEPTSGTDSPDDGVGEPADVQEHSGTSTVRGN